MTIRYNKRTRIRSQRLAPKPKNFTEKTYLSIQAQFQLSYLISLTADVKYINAKSKVQLWYVYYQYHSYQLLLGQNQCDNLTAFGSA